MDDNWIADYEKTSSNALTIEWFVSPLEYSWPGGKTGVRFDFLIGVELSAAADLEWRGGPGELGLDGGVEAIGPERMLALQM